MPKKIGCLNSPLILKRIIGSSMCIFCVFAGFPGPVTNFIGCFLLLLLVRRLWTPRSRLSFNFGGFGRFCPKNRGYAESIGILIAVELNFRSPPPPHFTYENTWTSSDCNVKVRDVRVTLRSPNLSERLI